MKEGLIKRLIASIKCSSCGQHYEEYNVKIMEHRGEFWFLRVFCSSCHVGSMVAAIIREDKPKVITDLNKEELKSFSRFCEINWDDFLDMHNYLGSFDGDFRRLFKRE
jgi:hypothetical protein